MNTILPPQNIPSNGISIFLAGTIDMGNSIDWQQQVVEELMAEQALSGLNIFNPRRKDWE
nr:nucleoside 2-deoxyribosyltransferase domain-containing protein [Pedobacter frigidisoli]